MASKKDKFKKVIKKRIEQDGEGDKPGMQGFVADMSRRHRGADVPEQAPDDESAGPAPVAADAASESAPAAEATAKAPIAEPTAVDPPSARVKPEPAAPVKSDPAAPVQPGSAAPSPTAASAAESPARRRTEPDQMSAGSAENLISAPSRPAETVPERGSTGAFPRQRPTMARTRDSVYNVSSDIRLEDYTDSSSEGGGGIGAALRIGAGVVLLLFLLYGLYILGGMLFAPSYTLAVSSTPVTPENALQFAEAERVSTAAGQPVYIHFQWEEGELTTDYVKIQVDRINPGGGEIEEAILARRPPITANYIQFAGPLEVGKYRITVTDRNGRRLADRVVNVN